MMRFSFVFLFVAMFMLNSILLNPRLSAAAAAAAVAAAAVRDIPLDVVVAFETTALKCDEVECGISGADVTERIIGGEEAEPHAWPWQALVVCKNGTVSKTCGGSLVGDKWVITAAHCMFLDGVNECEAFLGKHYSSTSYEDEPEQIIIGTEKYFVHEEYVNSTLGFDIALLKLTETVQYDENIKPICLPFDLPELEDTSICYATGWGLDDRKQKKPAETLKQLKMPIHDDYGYCRFPPNAIEKKICAGSLDREDDLCKGDSGGPLACKETDGKWYLRGVASFVAGKAPDDICYSVASFTKVTAFLDWITEKFEDN